MTIEADRGQDLGRLVGVWTGGERPPPEAYPTGSRRSAQHKRILRKAMPSEVDQLPRKHGEEDQALEMCVAKVLQRNLPMEARL